MDTSVSVRGKLESILKMLSLNSKNVEKVIQKNKERDIEKALRMFRIDEAENLKISVQTLMFDEKKEEDVVREYGEEIDTKIDAYSEEIDRLQSVLDKLKREEVCCAKKKFEEEEQVRVQLRYEEEKRIEEMRIQMRSVGESSNESSTRNASRTESEVSTASFRETLPEFPKLKISQFKGTHLDWLRFWSQFEQIDKSNSHIEPY